MVHFLQCSNAHTPFGLLFFSVFFLLLTSSMEVAYSDARRFPLRRLREIDTSKEEAEIRGEMKGRALIGSRPPRCERVCMSCGHCEAVQVPIVPRDHQQKRATGADQEHVVSDAAAAAAIGTAMFTYRVDGITNYKPLSWKCKCGGTILDP
ncbi:EPIDERMAL PATTERNING FACTOR-like protein 2 isoform X2 [Phragmites australis]|uniref:EPIDERMAL PATTERNING FACTOR-like protein 2 isoform X2 n=1 Tax=Phragmites australis TaxID=29695 RepID=UPI002D77BE08|nr:EPIDERMAL PATTERNING FACTOR-like protein 2 isoform X2 [Phragmites australis]